MWSAHGQEKSLKVFGNVRIVEFGAKLNGKEETEETREENEGEVKVLDNKAR